MRCRGPHLTSAAERTLASILLSVTNRFRHLLKSLVRRVIEVISQFALLLRLRACAGCPELHGGGLYGAGAHGREEHEARRTLPSPASHLPDPLLRSQDLRDWPLLYEGYGT